MCAARLHVLQLYVVCSYAGDPGLGPTTETQQHVDPCAKIDPLCYDVIVCWLWKEKGTSFTPSWVLYILASHQWFVFHSVSPAVMFNYRYLRNKCFCEYSSWRSSFWLLTSSGAFLFQQRTASLSQLPVEDLRDPLPPHWRCYMSPQGRRYYVNTTNNGTSSGDFFFQGMVSHAGKLWKQIAWIKFTKNIF